MRYYYTDGLPFSRILAENIDMVFDRVRKNKAAMIIVDGNVGEGKTTLGWQIGKYITKKVNNRVAVMEEQLATGGEEFGKKLLLCHDKGHNVIVYDEAGDFDKKTTLSRFNRNLMRVFEMYRGFKILVVLCIPKFYKLENELLDLGIPRMLLHCERRTEEQGSFRAFDVEQMYYIKHAATKLIVKPKCYDSGIPNFYGHFLDLPVDESKKLSELSIKMKRREVRKNVGQVKDRVTLKDISKELGVSTRYVLQKMKRVDVGDVTVFERKKYYDRGIIKSIEATME